MSKPTKPDSNKQLLHLVFGGELKRLDSNEFRDLNNVDIVVSFRIMRRLTSPGRVPRKER